jgi:hypothetical protein
MIESIGFIAVFLLGLFVGASLLVYGYKLGFKASYEIRKATVDEDQGGGLFKEEKDPAEFDLLEEQEK